VKVLDRCRRLCLKWAVDSLNDEVRRQRNIITVLTQRLEFLMSMFGIDDGTMQNVDLMAEDPPSQAVVDERRAGGASACRTFQNAVGSAIYAEQQQQERRAMNFVVCGLPVTKDIDDKKAVEQLCDKEMQMQVNIRSCRRLGKQQNDKIQPILVRANTAEEAATVISNAKLLRRSEDMLVRRQVYVNADLTKAQAAAAYERRCQRRKRQQDRASQDVRLSTVTADALPVFACNVDSYNVSGCAAVQNTLPSAGLGTLNPAASSFLPEGQHDS